METLSKNIQKLTFVGYLLIFFGIYSIGKTITELSHNNLWIDFGVLGIFIGYGLLKFYALYRVLAVIYIFIYFLLSLFTLFLYLSALISSTMPLTFTSVFTNLIPIGIRIGIIYWSFRVLTKPIIMKLFDNRLTNYETYFQIEILPEDFICIHCGADLELEQQEREQKQFTCPSCNKINDLTKEKNPKDSPSRFEIPVIKFLTKIPESLKNPGLNLDYVEILSTISTNDILILKSILDANGISYWLQGEKLYELFPLGCPIKLFVRKDQVKEANDLLAKIEIHNLGASINIS